MLETKVETREIFPMLPFYVDLPAIVLSGLMNPTDDLSCSNVSSENENENGNNNYFINNNVCFQNQPYQQHKKKSPVNLSEDASDFKFSFYRIFTSRKKFPKKYVTLIHNEICQSLNLPRITRDECRSIDLYFIHYYQHSKDILFYLTKNKDRILHKIPELKTILY